MNNNFARGKSVRRFMWLPLLAILVAQTPTPMAQAVTTAAVG